MVLIAGVVLLLAAFEASALTKLQEQFYWTNLDFAFPDETTRQQAIQQRRFIPENNLPVGIEIWNDKLFVSVPRWRPGIPATLNYIPLYEETPRSPALIPYPSWRGNQLGDCERGLTTVYRMKVDACDRLWVLDTGTYGIGNTTTNPCPYALNVFDLHTDVRLRRYEFRTEDTNQNTFIANIAVDLGASCDDAYAYFSDELGYGLIAYSWEQNRSWRFEHSYFFPDPLAGDFNIGGLNFQWGEEGIFGITLSPIQPDGHRLLFFNPLASNREFAVSTRVLRNSSAVEDSYHEFLVLEERGPNGHVTSSFMDDDGLLFFNLIDQDGVGCWNSERPYHPRNHALMDSDPWRLSFPADVKVDRSRNLWVISDRMPNFLIASLDPNEVNFRIMFAPVDVMIRGTVCEPRGPHAKGALPPRNGFLAGGKALQGPAGNIGNNYIANPSPSNYLGGAAGHNIPTTLPAVSAPKVHQLALPFHAVDHQASGFEFGAAKSIGPFSSPPPNFYY